MTEHTALPMEFRADTGEYGTYHLQGDIGGETIGEREDIDQANARFLGIACNNYERLADAVDELLEVADHRGDNQLPAPEDDPLLWSGRMQDAWDELAAIRNAEEQACSSSA